MKQRFFVDWSDPPFPQIFPIEQASSDAEPLTITEAREAIIRHFQYQIDHARNQILIARQTTAAQILEEAEVTET